MLNRKMVALLTIPLLFSMAGCSKEKDKVLTITNVSYDPTREFYEAYNEMFEAHYFQTYQEEIKVIQSHGGSSTQARSVVEGCNADVVTLALERDITLIANTGLIDTSWKERLPLDSSPYTSTIVFLVRANNPKEIMDWGDCIKDGVDVITPDPKSSGGACWNFLAAYSYALEKYETEEEQKEFMRRFYQNVSVMDLGARASTTTFVENHKGDVLIAWENEAKTILENYPGQYELVSPSISILAQPSVSIVDENVEYNGTKEASEAYLSYLYSEEAQRLVASFGYRPSNEEILEEYADEFDLSMKLTTIDDFGGWDTAYINYFEDGALFDEIYE